MTRSARRIAVVVVLTIAAGCGGTSGQRAPAERREGAPARGPASALDSALAERLQAVLDKVRQDQGIPGASAAVVFASGDVWTGVSGHANARARRPVTDETLFAIGSVTKTFVAALMVRLAESGVLGLDDRLSRWVPDFPHSRENTVRQLLKSHLRNGRVRERPALCRRAAAPAGRAVDAGADPALRAAGEVAAG